MLKDLITGIQNSSSWGIWAKGTEPESEARYGQAQFENGGLLDDKTFIIDGEQANRAMLAYCDGDLNWFAEHGDPADFVAWCKENGYIDE